MIRSRPRSLDFNLFLNKYRSVNLSMKSFLHSGNPFEFAIQANC